MCKVWKNEPHNPKSLARRKIRARDNHPKKRQVPQGTKRRQTKGKGKVKEKVQGSVNVLNITDLPELSITSSKSINFSCYETSEKVEWFLDSGCTNHITPRKSDFVQYRELGQAHSIEIADGKYLKIEGYGTVIGHSIMQEGMASLQIQNVLYVPEVNKLLFLLITARQCGSMSQTMNNHLSILVSTNGENWHFIQIRINKIQGLFCPRC